MDRSGINLNNGCKANSVSMARYVPFEEDAINIDIIYRSIEDVSFGIIDTQIYSLFVTEDAFAVHGFQALRFIIIETDKSGIRTLYSIYLEISLSFRIRHRRLRN